ncbi:hypothetical protein FH972_022424 [Carpinus fangiana]|uniref:Mre11 DNA-binding domain-containing protein n=1 Tax=Carpinus fangiana TaxID=176857 RepID=A0A5N6KSW0_9ROSI|nr:hypothetical protein FH972_022424 [Carpinus fangiana]
MHSVDIMTPAKLFWAPPEAGRTPMDSYRRHVNKTFSQQLEDSKQLQAWTVENPQQFWVDLYSYLQLVPPLPRTLISAYDQSKPISSIPTWFEEHKLNYAENVLFSNPDPDAVALIGLRENLDLQVEEKVTWGDLRERVRQTASAMKRHGLNKGDRVAALVATSVWAMVLFLATASVGGVFTSISPDLGTEGCVSRLDQITPSILFADSDLTSKGRRSSIISKVKSIVDRLSTKPQVFIIPVIHPAIYFPSITAFLSRSSPSDALTFLRVPFNSPLVICYSSGTTGAPKCIVHQHGLILQLKKISRLHNSLGPRDVVMQYSSTSWVLFYIMNGHFSTGATCICYDGSPLWPNARQMPRILEKFKATYFGTSPRYLLELELANILPRDEFDLSRLRMVNTTGASLSVDQYHYFYRAFSRTTHLSNSAGGTDSATSLLSIDPSGPITPGEMQMPALGMAVDVADPVTGESIAHTGAPGELIVRKPFPSMPTCFWGDTGGKIYHAAYFERFTGVDVWAQHDWVSRNPATGGWVMTGRSDGILNPSGIRFGSGEIYGIAEAPPFTTLHGIAETLCVGRRRPRDRDEAVFLFVRMSAGFVFTPELRERLKGAIAAGLSKRHVPRFVVGVEEIPVTVNGKKVEVAVKRCISGDDVKASATVANPWVLEAYKKYTEMESEPRDGKLSHYRQPLLTDKSVPFDVFSACMTAGGERGPSHVQGIGLTYGTMFGPVTSQLLIYQGVPSLHHVLEPLLQLHSKHHPITLYWRQSCHQPRVTWPLVVRAKILKLTKCTDASPDTIRILISTDNHVGYNERDPVRGDDSWKTFHEVMCLAKERDVDLVLLAGDLFHENNPSRKSMYQVMRSLRMNCYGEKPCELEMLSDASENFQGAFNHVNYEDQDINVAIPVFSIHGNHDDPSGQGYLAALDILQMSGLLNYYGRTPQSDNIAIKPVLLQKGRTKLALYGMSNVRDERLFRTFRDGKVKFYQPGTQRDNWFNLMSVHQNHHAYTETGYLPENFLPDFLDLVVWGHEHECLVDPRFNPEMGFHVMQPGSSVATSLVPGEAVNKRVAILSVTAKKFECETIPLKTVRPFVMKEIVLQEEPSMKSLAKKSDNRSEITRYLTSIVENLIEQAKTTWLETQEGEETDEDLKIPLPLVRLRVEYTAPEGGSFDCENPQRFSGRFAGRVANTHDVVQFHRKKTTVRKLKDNSDLPEEATMAALSLDTVKVEKLVREFLTAQSLTILPQNSFGDAVSQFVDKDDKHAMEMFVSESLTNQVKHLLKVDEADEEEIALAMGEYRSKLEELFAAGHLKRARKVKPKPAHWDSDMDGAWEDQPGALALSDKEGDAEEEADPVPTPATRGRGRGRGKSSGTTRSTATTKRATPVPKPTARAASRRNKGPFDDDDSVEDNDVIMIDDDDDDDDENNGPAASTVRPSTKGPSSSRTSTRNAGAAAKRTTSRSSAAPRTNQRQTQLDFSQNPHPTRRANGAKKVVQSDDEISDDDDDAFEVADSSLGGNALLLSFEKFVDGSNFLTLSQAESTAAKLLQLQLRGPTMTEKERVLSLSLPPDCQSLQIAVLHVAVTNKNSCSTPHTDFSILTAFGRDKNSGMAVGAAPARAYQVDELLKLRLTCKDSSEVVRRINSEAGIKDRISYVRRAISSNLLLHGQSRFHFFPEHIFVSFTMASSTAMATQALPATPSTFLFSTAKHHVSPESPKDPLPLRTRNRSSSIITNPYEGFEVPPSDEFVPFRVKPNGRSGRPSKYSPTPSIKRGKAEMLLKEHGSPPGIRVTAGGRIVPDGLSPITSPRYDQRRTTLAKSSAHVHIPPVDLNNLPSVSYLQSVEGYLVVADGIIYQVHNGRLVAVGQLGNPTLDLVCAPANHVMVPGMQYNNGVGFQIPAHQMSAAAYPPNPEHEAIDEHTLRKLEECHAKFQEELRDLDRNEVLQRDSLTPGGKREIVRQRIDLVNRIDDTRRSILRARKILNERLAASASQDAPSNASQTTLGRVASPLAFQPQQVMATPASYGYGFVSAFGLPTPDTTHYPMATPMLQQGFGFNIANSSSVHSIAPDFLPFHPQHGYQDHFTGRAGNVGLGITNPFGLDEVENLLNRPTVVLPPPKTNKPDGPGHQSKRSHAVAIKAPEPVATEKRIALNPTSPSYQPSEDKESHTQGASPIADAETLDIATFMPSPTLIAGVDQLVQSPERPAVQLNRGQSGSKHRESSSTASTADFFPQDAQDHSTTRYSYTDRDRPTCLGGWISQENDPNAVSTPQRLTNKLIWNNSPEEHFFDALPDHEERPQTAFASRTPLKSLYEHKSVPSPHDGAHGGMATVFQPSPTKPIRIKMSRHGHSHEVTAISGESPLARTPSGKTPVGYLMQKSIKHDNVPISPVKDLCQLGFEDGLANKLDGVHTGLEYLQGLREGLQERTKQTQVDYGRSGVNMAAIQHRLACAFQAHGGERASDPGYAPTHRRVSLPSFGPPGAPVNSPTSTPMSTTPKTGRASSESKFSPATALAFSSQPNVKVVDMKRGIGTQTSGSRIRRTEPYGSPLANRQPNSMRESSYGSPGETFSARMQRLALQTKAQDTDSQTCFAIHGKTSVAPSTEHAHAVFDGSTEETEVKRQGRMSISQPTQSDQVPNMTSRGTSPSKFLTAAAASVLGFGRRLKSPEPQAQSPASPQGSKQTSPSKCRVGWRRRAEDKMQNIALAIVGAQRPVLARGVWQGDSDGCSMNGEKLHAGCGIARTRIFTGPAMLASSSSSSESERGDPMLLLLRWHPHNLAPSFARIGRACVTESDSGIGVGRRLLCDHFTAHRGGRPALRDSWILSLTCFYPMIPHAPGDLKSFFPHCHCQYFTMDIFIRNVPPNASERQLRLVLKPALDAQGISTYLCQKATGKQFATITVHDRIGAEAFLSLHGVPQHAPYKTKARSSLVMLGRELLCTEGRNTPHKLVIESLKRKDAEARKIQSSSRYKSKRSAAATAAAAQHTFTIAALDNGIWDFEDTSIRYHSSFELSCRGSLVLGKKSLVIVLPPNDTSSNASTLQIRIEYLTIESIALAHDSTPNVSFTLNQSPNFYRIREASDISTLLQGLSLDVPRQEQRARVCGISPTHTKLSGLCLVYRVQLSNFPQLKSLEKTLRLMDGGPGVIVPDNSSPSIHRDLLKENELLLKHLSPATNSSGEGSDFVPFLLRFQLQRLVQNGYMNPARVFELAVGMKDLVKKYHVFAIVEAIRSVAHRLPYMAPGISVTQFHPKEILKSLSSVAAAFVAKGTIYELAKKHTHLALIHKVIVTPCNLYLEGPELEAKNRVLRKYPRHAEHFIRVSFLDENQQNVQYETRLNRDDVFRSRFSKILDSSISICGRAYSFLGFSHSSLRTHQCWFMSPFLHDGTLQVPNQIIKNLGDFTAIRSPAKCAARIGQAFSDTTDSVKLGKDCRVTLLPDIERNGRCFTDGVGTISGLLLRDVWARFSRTNKQHATLLQIRQAGAKGMVSLDATLTGRQLRLRPSMIKFEGTIDSDLEICGAGYRPLPLFLNQQSIKILEDLGTNPQAFLDLQQRALQELGDMVQEPLLAAKYLEKNLAATASKFPNLIRKLHHFGLNFRDDDFMRKAVDVVALTQLRDIKYRARIQVANGYTLLGVADTTGVLRANQVHVAVRDKNGQTSNLRGSVLITRAPALHPGDLQIREAVDVPPDSPLRYLHNCIIFSVQGHRDLPSCLSGGDLDGDLYNIIVEPTLWPPGPVTPADYPRLPPLDIQREVEIGDITEFFIKFMETDQLGYISNTHKQVADLKPDGTLNNACIKLAEMASTAVDYSKTGIAVNMNEMPKDYDRRLKPDFMARAPNLIIDSETLIEEPDLDEDEHEDPVSLLQPDRPRPLFYRSRNILGKLYRAVDEDSFLPKLHVDDQKRRIRIATSHRGVLARKTIMEQIWDYIKKHCQLLEYQHYKALAGEIKQAYESDLCDTMFYYSSHPRQPLTEVEVFSGVILGRAGGMPNKRTRETNVDMKGKYDRNVSYIVDWILRGDADEAYEGESNLFEAAETASLEETEGYERLARTLAVLETAMQKPGLRVQGAGELQSFKYVAAAVCLKEMDKVFGVGWLR